MTRTAKKTLRPGHRMKDGTVFAGISPDTGENMFVTPRDIPGKPKTWEAAVEYAEGLDAHGHKDWSLPSEFELKELFNNKASIGNFDAGQRKTKRTYYYASTRETADNDWWGGDPFADEVLAQDFRDGTRHWISRKEDVFRARPVRREPRPPCACDI